MIRILKIRAWRRALKLNFDNISRWLCAVAVCCLCGCVEPVAVSASDLSFVECDMLNNMGCNHGGRVFVRDVGVRGETALVSGDVYSEAVVYLDVRNRGGQSIRMPAIGQMEWQLLDDRGVVLPSSSLWFSSIYDISRILDAESSLGYVFGCSNPQRIPRDRRVSVRLRVGETEIRSSAKSGGGQLSIPVAAGVDVRLVRLDNDLVCPGTNVLVACTGAEATCSLTNGVHCALGAVALLVDNYGCREVGLSGFGTQAWTVEVVLDGDRSRHIDFGQFISAEFGTSSFSVQPMHTVAYVFGVRELTQSAVEIEAIRVKYADEYRHLMAELKWNDGRRKTQVMSLSGKCHNNDDDVVVDVDI